MQIRLKKSPEQNESWYRIDVATHKVLATHFRFDVIALTDLSRVLGYIEAGGGDGVVWLLSDSDLQFGADAVVLL